MGKRGDLIVVATKKTWPAAKDFHTFELNSGRTTAFCPNNGGDLTFLSNSLNILKSIDYNRKE